MNSLRDVRCPICQAVLVTLVRLLCCCSAVCIEPCLFSTSSFYRLCFSDASSIFLMFSGNDIMTCIGKGHSAAVSEQNTVLFSLFYSYESFPPLDSVHWNVFSTHFPSLRPKIIQTGKSLLRGEPGIGSSIYTES